MCVCVCVCVLYACMCMYRYVCTPTHLKLHVVFSYRYNSRIGTLMVVKKRAVIERQSHVRLVVAKGIFPRGLVVRKGFGQKQCHPAPQHYLILFERSSCKNSDTSCLKIKAQIFGAKFIRNRYRYRTNFVQIYSCKSISLIQPSNSR